MAPEKKSKSRIIRAIINSVSEAPKSIYELSKELNSNWDTIKNNVTLLKDLGILDVVEQKIFLKSDKSISIHDDTVAGLPLSDDARKRIYAVAKKINDKWKNVTGEEPNKTHLQKAIVEISEKFPSLNIPRGWYFYGKIVLINVDKTKFNENLDKYDFKRYSINLKEFESCILEVINTLKDLSNSELLDYQYEKYNKKDYLIKRNVERLFLEKKFDKEKFSNLLYKLIFNFRLIKDDPLNHKVISIIKEAISVMISKTYIEDIDKNINFKLQLMETFTIFWKLFATYGLLISLEGELGYDKRYIMSIFADRINFYRNDLNDFFNNCAVMSQ